MTAFETKLKGTLYGLLRWPDWDALRRRLTATDAEWFAYAVGSEPPLTPLVPAALGPMLEEIDALLRRDHQTDTFGIVYVDALDRPTLVKIYDPNQLGSACGSRGQPVPPGWVLSRDPPSRIDAPVLPGQRRRWWTGLRDRLAV